MSPAALRRAPQRARRDRCRRSGLVYLNNRYHDPVLGAFISVDPLVTTTGEAYIYGSANPITLSDPTGLCSMMDPNVDACYAARQQAASLVPFVFTNSNGDVEVTVRVDPGVPLEQSLLSHWDADWAGTQWEREVFFEGMSQSHGHMAAESSEVARSRDLTERTLYDLEAWGNAGRLEYEINKGLMEGLTAWGFLRLAAPKSPQPTRTVVIGRNISERVIPYAKSHGFDFYKGTPKWVPRRVIGSVSPRALERVDVWFNKRWIRREIRKASRIVDIGEPQGYRPSPYYEMERQQVAGYRNYVRNVQ